MSLIRHIQCPAGFINGGLKFNSTTVPPYLRSGTYEINGNAVNLSADLAYATTDILGDHILRQNVWYLHLMDQYGNKAIQLYAAGQAVKTYSITSISSNQISFSGNASGTQPATGMIAVIDGATTESNNHCWIIGGTGGSPTVTSVTTTGNLVNQASAGGTVKVYYAMDTYHGTGAYTGFLAGSGNASPLIYTPSALDAEVGWTLHDHITWDPIRNGYYSLRTGYTNYRVLGCWSVNNSSNIQDVISYNSGKNKNDNAIRCNTYSSLVTNVVRFATFASLWGNDYILTDDITNGTMLTLYRSMAINSSAALYATGGAFCTIQKNGTTTIQQDSALNLGKSQSNAAGTIGFPANSRLLNKGDTVRALQSGSADATANRTFWETYFTILEYR